MALPTLDATFASAADLPRRQMLAKWLVEELGETPPSDLLISGVDDYVGYDVNGLIPNVGVNDGRPLYEKELIDAILRISWEASSYWLIGLSGDDLFTSNDNVAYPWLVTTWTAQNATGTLVVTEVANNPISNYYDLPERYLWAKIAVAAGGPKDEAAYIGLPKQYAWSDIYNAVSGDIAKSTVVVSGLSATQYNGMYVYDGDVSGRPSYRLNGDISIYWDVSQWALFDNDSGNFTRSASDVAYPWLATGWGDEGINPTGLVLTPETPNHIDWTEKQALGHIAAAYRGDTANPANLATYIDWPWRYQVASIIAAL